MVLDRDIGSLLLAVVRGETIDGHAPTLEQRLDAAKAAAPYFAPKLAAIEMQAKTVYRISKEPMSPEELKVKCDAWAARYVLEH